MSPLLKKEHDYIVELKLKKMEDPIKIERVVDLSGLTKYQMVKQKGDDLVWYLTLCVLNWINVEYIITDENRLYINKKDINKNIISKVITFIRSRAYQ